MANKPIAMSKLRSVLRMYTEGRSKKQISLYCGLSKNTVKRYIRKFGHLKMTLEDLESMSDRKLYELFQMPSEKEPLEKLKILEAFFPYMQKELKKTGVSRRILWAEYRKANPEGYGLTRFGQHYNRWRGTGKPFMHIDHKAGDKMYVDYTGKRLEYIDRQSGEIKEAEVFVSILGSSQLIYVEASESQCKEDFITSVDSALQYYGGVPLAIVPDNLKSAVTKSHRYEPSLNETFEDFADHYQTTILPARVYRPRDKALVEGAVKIVYSAIFTQIQKQEFYAVDELNTAIRPLLEALNDRKLTGRPYSRRELFVETEKVLLRSLPSERYEIKQTAWATVMKTGHVCLQKDKHYYSVPFKFIGKKVKLVWSSKQVGIYLNYECIARHTRTKSPYNYTTQEEHLASTHRFIAQWNPEFFQRWARDIHPHVELLINNILEKKKYPEQAYRSCMGVLGLAKKVGNARLAEACSRALDYGICNYHIVHTILEKGLDKIDEESDQDYAPPVHKNIRGKQYYA